MTTYKLQQKDDHWFTDQILSEEEWLQVICAADNEQHRQQLEVLRMFLCQPEHKGTCSQIGKEYSMSGSTINLLVQHFGRFVQKNCGKEFRIETTVKDGNTFWPITMIGKNLKGSYYEWKLRPELVTSIRRFLINKLLEAYREPVISEGLNNTRSSELYKWQFISSVHGKSIIEIVHSMMTKECNFAEKPHSGATILSLLDSNPEMVIHTFEILLQDNPLDDRLREFSAAAKRPLHLQEKLPSAMKELLRPSSLVLTLNTSHHIQARFTRPIASILGLPSNRLDKNILIF